MSNEPFDNRSLGQLALNKLKAQRDLLKITIDQLIEVNLFRKRWDQGAKALAELNMLIDAIEMDLEDRAS